MLHVQGIVDWTKSELEEYVRQYIEEKLWDAGEDNVELLGVAVYGSRCNGCAVRESDLDVVVEYRGDLREDDFFSLVNEEEEHLEIAGVRVDINPITEGKSGTLEEFLKRANGFKKREVKEFHDFSFLYLEDKGALIQGLSERDNLETDLGFIEESTLDRHVFFSQLWENRTFEAVYRLAFQEVCHKHFEKMLLQGYGLENVPRHQREELTSNPKTDKEVLRRLIKEENDAWILRMLQQNPEVGLLTTIHLACQKAKELQEKKRTGKKKESYESKRREKVVKSDKGSVRNY